MALNNIIINDSVTTASRAIRSSRRSYIVKNHGSLGWIISNSGRTSNGGLFKLNNNQSYLKEDSLLYSVEVEFKSGRKISNEIYIPVVRNTE